MSYERSFIRPIQLPSGSRNWASSVRPSGRVTGLITTSAPCATAASSVFPNVIGLQIDRHAPGADTSQDPAPDARPHGIGRHEPITRRVVGVDRPAEDLLVEVVQPLAVPAVNLEMRYWVSHGLLLGDVWSFVGPLV